MLQTPPTEVLDQPRWDFGEAAAIEEHIKSMIIKKVGNRREWEDWAQDVGEICSRQVAHIKTMIGDGGGDSAFFQQCQPPSLC